MRDFLLNPPFTKESLGQPMPDSPHAVSVSLPTWDAVIGYEEKEPEVVDRMQLGYPRFVLHPAVGRLFAHGRETQAAGDEEVIVLPGESSADRAVVFLGKRGIEARAVSLGRAGLFAVVFQARHLPTARLFWRFTGEIVSSRQAEAFFAGDEGASTVDEQALAYETMRHRLAQWSGQHADDVYLFPSGMAATFFVHQALTLVSPGRPTMQVDFPYVDVLRVQKEFGMGCSFFQGCDEGMEAWCRENRPFGVFAEMPSNPLLRCVDPEDLARRCRELDCPLILDDTIASVANTDAFRFADAVTTSLTKWVSGEGDVMAGSLILRRDSPFYERLSAALRSLQAPRLWGGDAVVLERNSRNFEERMKIVNATASELTHWLKNRPEMGRIWYPEWECRDAYDKVRRADGGFGGLFSLVIRGGESQARKLYDALRVAKGPSLGTVFSLACPYTLLAHYDELPWAASCGVPRDLIRFSTGCEDPSDLIDRWERAFRAVG